MWKMFKRVFLTLLEVLILNLVIESCTKRNKKIISCFLLSRILFSPIAQYLRQKISLRVRDVRSKKFAIQSKAAKFNHVNRKSKTKKSIICRGEFLNSVEIEIRKFEKCEKCRGQFPSREKFA